MGTTTGWNHHPAQISWSLVTHWPTLYQPLIWWVKTRNFDSSNSNYHRCMMFTSRYMFSRQVKTMELVEIDCQWAKLPNRQYGHHFAKNVCDAISNNMKLMLINAETNAGVKLQEETVFSCDQAALRTVQSVCLSVCLCVCLLTPFSLCSHHRIIMKFSGVITIDKNDVHAKGQGQRSKVKVTEVKTQFSRFRTVTPVWICIWWWNDARRLMLLRRGALLLFKVIRQISRSHGTENRRFNPNWAFPGCNSSLNSLMAVKWCTKLEAA